MTEIQAIKLAVAFDHNKDSSHVKPAFKRESF